MKKIHTLIALMLCLSCYAQDGKYTWTGQIKTTNNKKVEFANIQVKTKGSYYLFVADNKGYAEIKYPQYHVTDSVVISSIGYKTKAISCAELKQKKIVMLEKEIYNIDEVVVKPIKYKTIKLGNKNWFTIRSSQISFNFQSGIYIPNDKNIKGKLTTVRVYMHSFFHKNWKYRPFRLRLFEGKYPFKKEITQDTIIASLKTKRGHWVNIDVSNFNIELPKNGIFVVVEALSFEYYKKNGYITHSCIDGGVTNSISIGATGGPKTRDKVICYDRYNGNEAHLIQLKKWKQTDKNWYYLIQIKVKCRKD